MKQLLRDINDFYQNVEQPNYSKVQKQHNNGFPALLLEKLNDKFWIKDVTDVNSDVAFFLNLLSETERYLVIYSFVTNGFHIMCLVKNERFDSQPDYSHFSSLEKNAELVMFCKRYLPENTKYLSKKTLQKKIKFNWDGNGTVNTALYKVLFLQEHDLPYF